MEFKEFSEYTDPLSKDYDITSSSSEEESEEEETEEEYFKRVNNYYNNIGTGNSYNELFGNNEAKKGRSK